MRSRLSAIPDEIHPPKRPRTSQPLHYPCPPFLQSSSVEIRRRQASLIPRPRDSAPGKTSPCYFPSSPPPLRPLKTYPSFLPRRSSPPQPRVCRARPPLSFACPSPLPAVLALAGLKKEGGGKKEREKRKEKRAARLVRRRSAFILSIEPLSDSLVR